MSRRGHALAGDLTRAGYAAEALRTLLLADGDDGERDLVRGTLAELAGRLRATPWRSPEVRRAALRLAAAVESPASMC